MSHKKELGHLHLVFTEKWSQLLYTFFRKCNTRRLKNESPVILCNKDTKQEGKLVKI
jgi:hypothetical protein